MGFIDKALHQAHKAIDKHGPKVQTGLEKAKVEAGKAARKHAPKVHQGIEKAAATVDQRTGGKHTDKIQVARDKVSQGFTTATERMDATARQNAGGRHTSTQTPVAEPDHAAPRHAADSAQVQGFPTDGQFFPHDSGQDRPGGGTF